MNSCSTQTTLEDDLNHSILDVKLLELKRKINRLIIVKNLLEKLNLEKLDNCLKQMYAIQNESDELWHEILKFKDKIYLEILASKVIHLESILQELILNAEIILDQHKNRQKNGNNVNQYSNAFADMASQEPVQVKITKAYNAKMCLKSNSKDEKLMELTIIEEDTKINSTDRIDIVSQNLNPNTNQLSQDQDSVNFDLKEKVNVENNMSMSSTSTIVIVNRDDDYEESIDTCSNVTSNGYRSTTVASNTDESVKEMNKEVEIFRNDRNNNCTKNEEQGSVKNLNSALSSNSSLIVTYEEIENTTIPNSNRFKTINHSILVGVDNLDQQQEQETLNDKIGYCTKEEIATSNNREILYRQIDSLIVDLSWENYREKFSSFLLQLNATTQNGSFLDINEFSFYLLRVILERYNGNDHNPKRESRTPMKLYAQLLTDLSSQSIMKKQNFCSILLSQIKNMYQQCFSLTFVELNPFSKRMQMVLKEMDKSNSLSYHGEQIVNDIGTIKKQHVANWTLVMELYQTSLIDHRFLMEFLNTLFEYLNGIDQRFTNHKNYQECLFYFLEETLLPIFYKLSQESSNEAKHYQKMSRNLLKTLKSFQKSPPSATRKYFACMAKHNMDSGHASM